MKFSRGLEEAERPSHLGGSGEALCRCPLNWVLKDRWDLDQMLK